MKKAVYTLALAALLLTMLAIPAFAAAYEATLMGQLDTDVPGSAAIGEWDIEKQPGAKVSFELGKQATITMEFAEPIKFSSNWTGISTNFPVTSDEDAEASMAKIISFKVDGKDLGAKKVPLINRDNSGFLTIDVSRKWGGDYDVYGLADMAPFSKLEITFMVGEAAAGSAPAAKTGDATMIGLAGLLLVLSAGGAILLKKRLA